MTRDLPHWLLSEITDNRLISEPQDPRCKLAILVPVFDERPESVLRQIRSLAAQNGDLSRFELTYLVNNHPDDGTVRWQQAYRRNQEVLALPVFRNRTVDPEMDTAEFAAIRRRLAIFAVDHSSPQLWVSDSNVGRARRHGLNESAWRFKQNGREGIVLHTDADCYFPDRDFLSILLEMFADPLLIAMGGFPRLEIDPDDPESLEILATLDSYRNMIAYRHLAGDIKRGSVEYNPEKMLGRCLTHLVSLGIELGGIEPISVSEDLNLAEKLKDYARTHGLRVLPGLPGSIGPVTTLRVSERTGNSGRPLMDTINSGGLTMVEDVFQQGDQVALTSKYIARLAAVVATMAGGQDHLDSVFKTSPTANITILESSRN